MFVIKRDGTHQIVLFDKITARISNLGRDLIHCDPVVVSQKVCAGVYSGVSTIDLDELAAETAASMTPVHPEYGSLAARISISNLHKTTSASFSETMKSLWSYKSNGVPSPMISDETHDVVEKHAEEIDSWIDYSRDFRYDFFGFKTLFRGYLLKMDGRVVERPQHMWMRVAIGIHGVEEIERIRNTYDMLSTGEYTHGSPCLFYSGTPNPQMSSCFLLTMKEDSISGIYDTLKECALISKSAGGIGLSVHDIRASHSYIRGTNGVSNGLVPMLRVFNDTARYVDQGGGKRKGAFAIYLEPWHADVFDFLDLRKNQGKEEQRARDLFYGLWVPDLFMKRVEEDSTWSLFCPSEAPGLSDCWGEAFEKLYTQYESEKRARKVIKAQELWYAILVAQTETGNPYMLFKDQCNRKSNQQNLGTIKSSNLCTEIIEYSSPDETAVCNLASIAVSAIVKDKDPETAPSMRANGKLVGSADASKRFFDFEELIRVTRTVTYNLNRVIDRNYYPVETAKRSNMRHRPVGIGIQGLADAFLTLGIAFESPEAAQLNRQIFEAIYFAALTESCNLAKIHGPYETYAGSPISTGTLQFDMWDSVSPDAKLGLDWTTLRADIAKYGVRNSLLVAPMPTASTSQILGNNECFEPYTSNLYVRRVLSGEFTVANQHLMNDLSSMGLWGENMMRTLMRNNGSVQSINEIPAEMRELYKTVWEMKQRVIVDMAADRGAFIDQSQSLNIHIPDPTFKKLTSLHFYAWKKGLKTGMYYLRSKPASGAVKITAKSEPVGPAPADAEDCVMCGA